MPREVSAAGIAIYFPLIGIVTVAGPVLVYPRWPTSATWPALAMLGVFSTAAHVLFARGCLIAPAGGVGRLHYTSVLFFAALAWLIWGDRPNWFMAAGRAFIVATSAIEVRGGREAIAGRQPESAACLHGRIVRQDRRR